MTISNLGSGRPNNVSGFTTISISPQLGSCLLVPIFNRLDSTPSNIPSISGLSMTWSEINTIVHATGGGANQGVRVTLYIGQVTTVVSGTLTVSFAGQTQLDSAYCIDQVIGLDVRNNGLKAVLQDITGVVTSVGSQSLSLNPLSNINNICYAAFCNGGAGSSPGSGFTTLAIPSNAENISEYAINNPNASYSYTGPNASAGIAIELGISKQNGFFLL